jgi:hypothetical protein
VYSVAPWYDRFIANRSKAVRGSRALASHRSIRRGLRLYRGLALRRVVREAHGRSPGSEVRFDVHDGSFT